MSAKEYYENGQLQQAILVAIEEVKQEPQNINKRDFLRELLCIAGELERADKQLDIIAQQEPRAMMGVALMRQLIRAEKDRQYCFKAGGLPEFLQGPTPVLRHHLQALTELRAGNFNKASELLHQIDIERLPVRGELNGKIFNGFRDLDDTCASFFEILTSNGKYYWLPIESVKHIEFYKPERALDLIWRRAHITMHGDGPEGEVYFPAIYPTTELRDEEAKLGHKTDWHSLDNLLIQGSGQRVFLVGEQDVPMMDCKELIIYPTLQS